MTRKLQIRVLMVCVLFFASYATSYSQISQGGLPPGLELEQTKTIEPAPFEIMEDFDLDALRKEDAIVDGQPGMPWRFGNNFDVNLNPDNSGTWYELEDGSRLWRLGLTSKGALTLNLGFDKYKLADGAELFVYTPNGKNVQGAFTSFNNQQDGYFATAPIEGDAVIVEYYEPKGVAFEGEINIFRITHGYRGVGEMVEKGFGDSGSCNLNVACDEAEGWDSQIRSVAKILRNGSDWCTGALINNTENDGTPFFLSADHCYASEGTLVFVFNWQSETCEDPAVAPPVVHTISGAVTRARNAASDAWLLEFNDEIPEDFNIYFAGWNKDLSDAIDEEIIGIHHPSGDIKKFSFALGGVQRASYLGAPNSGTSHWRITWDGGTTTEPGSSGSPIFDAEGRILGQLHGGYAACGNVDPDWYGRFGVSMEGGLSQWLDPNNTGVAAIAGYDPILDAADPEAPAAVADFEVVAGDEGALSAALTWTNPSLTFEGETLTELTAIKIYRGGDLIETIDNPVMGEDETYTDNDITESGNYAYVVKAENSIGEGPQVSSSVFVGPDAPAQVQDLLLAAEENDGQLTWTAPVAGANDGYYDPTSLVEYIITRNPDNAEFTVAATETSFLDETLPGIGYYSYTVVAVNDIGEGTAATSNTVLLASEGAVFMGNGEVTSCEGTFFDSGGPDDDYDNNEDFTLTFFPEIDGAKMNFQFTAYNTENNYDFLYVYMGDEVDADELVGQFSGASVPEPLVDLISTHPTGAITFRFTSDGSVTRPGWEADFSCFIPADIDLDAVSIAGNTTPSEGIETTYVVTVLNRGTQAIDGDDYTVQIIDANDAVLATADGMDVAADASVQVEINWTPDQEGPIAIRGFVDIADDGNPENNTTDPLNVIVQPGDIMVVTIGSGTDYPNVRMPFDFYWRNSLTQSLYYPEEIEMGGGVITGVQYTNNFATDLPQRDIRIWVGETELEDLSGGWVDPADLQLVFDGAVDFPDGENDIFVPFEDVYVYTGGNLVVYTQRVWEQDYHSTNDRFYGTEDAGSNRTRRAAADGTEGLDPVNPPAGAASSWHPNTSLFFSTAGLGALDGTVTDGTNPVEGVLVKVLGTMASTLTDASGDYEFPFLLPDTYDLEFSKFGYETTVVSGVVVEEDETTTQDVAVTAFDQYTVTGIVEGNDGLLQAGAVVTLQGYDDYMVVTDTDGTFEIEDVFEGTYTLTVAAEGYEIYVDETVEVDGDLDLGTLTVIEIIVAPGNLHVDTDNHGAGNALLTWSDVSEREFRYDDGTATGQLGSSTGTINTVMGSAHRNDAVLTEMSWYLTEEGGPHNTVKVWVFGLDANGQPNPDDILYEMAGVSNTDEQWNTYEFTTPVEAPNGFLIGLSYAGFLGLGTDAGTSTDWPFMPNSNFFVGDVTADDFSAIEGLGDFSVNFLIRAFGEDNGEIDFDKDYVASTTTSHAVSYSKLTEPVVTGFPVYNNHNSVAGKAFTGFNVFLNGAEVASEITEMEYLFEDLDEGAYTAGVQSVYTTGTSDIITIEFDMVYGVEATITVTTNAGDSPEGAHVVLTNEDHEMYVYEHTVAADGEAHFDNVRKGLYTLHITLENFHDYIVENVDIQDDFAYTAELEEIITAPYGLLVETEGLPEGDALFSWNNTFGDTYFVDSFEDGTLDAWGEFVQGPGTPGEGGLAYWHASDDPDGLTAPDGDFVGKADWGFDIDTWLISPAIAVDTDGAVIFHWYSSYHWSVDPNPNAELMVKVSTDGGESWNEIWNWQEIGTWENFTWYETTLSLEDYAGQTVHVAMHLVGDDNAVTQIDDVRIGTADKAGTVAISQTPYVAADARSLPAGMKVQKAFSGYNVFLNGAEVASEIAETEHMFINLPNGTHEAGVQRVYTSGVSEIVTIDFEIEGAVDPEIFPVTFTVNDLSGTYQDIHIKGQMTDPEWEDIPMVEGADHVWTLTLDVAPGTYEWGITEAGDEWLLPEGENLEFTVAADGTVTGVVTYDLPLNVQDFMNNNISMFPNPVKEVVTLRSDNVMSEIRVMDMSGRVVYSGNVVSEEHQINVRSFESGIYFVQIITADGIFTGKLQVQK